MLYLTAYVKISGDLIRFAYFIKRVYPTFYIRKKGVRKIFHLFLSKNERKIYYYQALLSDRPSFSAAARCCLLNHLDIHEYEAFFDTANIDSLMVYCKDHWGVTYYPSNVPGSQQHKGVQKDWIQEVSNLLKKKNMNCRILLY